MKRLSLYIFMLLIILGTLSCGSDGDGPLGPGASQDEFGSIVVTAVDENENPFGGVLVKIDSESGETLFQQITDESGVARFDTLASGVYGVNAWSYRAIVNDNAPNIPHRVEGVVVAAGDTVQKKFYYPVEPYDVHVYTNAASDVSSQYDKLKLDFSGWDVESFLDGQGNCVLPDIDLRGVGPIISVAVLQGPYMLERLAGEWQTDPEGWPYLDLYVKSPPHIVIVSPANGAVFQTDTVEFTCIGEDLDDGILPEEALVWKSTSDGILGTGHTITARLNEGHHLIYVTGTDSDGNAIFDNIAIDINLASE